MSTENEQHFYIEFTPNGRGKAQCPPNPKFPCGTIIDGAHDKIGCAVNLPYPGPECGALVVTCLKCGVRAGVTCAGRVDDPKVLIIACKIDKKE
jgi:hypothetical protein